MVAVAGKYETFVLQNKDELTQLISLLRVEKVKSYLEIGSKFGGSLWKIANSLPVGSRVVSIDLPYGDGSFKESVPVLEKCIAHLRAIGYDARLLLGDSHNLSSVQFAEALGPYDCVMIDGDHTIEGVESDWIDYGKMGKIVCFHDISWKPRESKKMPVEVPEFWDGLKKRYRFTEIKHEEQNNGIGVLWRK